MQERSYTLPMCSVGRTSHVPSVVENVATDNHSPATIMSNDDETESESSKSTPELNLLLDKLTEILRFRSGCRRHFSMIQPVQQQTLSPPSCTTPNLERLQSSIVEPSPCTIDAPSIVSTGSSASAGSSKPTNIHAKLSLSNRSSHYHHHHHHHHHKHHSTLSSSINNLEKKRRLPSLLQRLIDEGNLIKEAVRRLKSQRFSHTFKQQQQTVINTPSTPTPKSSIQTLSNFTSRLTPSSSININLSTQLSNSPTQSTSSPNRGISWFLSSSVFGVNASTTNHSSRSGSPLRTCCSSSTHDRTPMEIGIHDG